MLTQIEFNYNYILFWITTLLYDNDNFRLHYIPITIWDMRIYNIS